VIVDEDDTTPRYRTQRWELIFLSHSPDYVATSTDTLLPIISAYTNPLQMKDIGMGERSQ
jgi:hypothetical protein